MPLLKAMFATLQLLLCVVMPKPVEPPGKIFDLYNQQSYIKDIKLCIRETAVWLCLLAAYNLRDAELALRVSMLQE
jgi:hypothetical protein